MPVTRLRLQLVTLFTCSLIVGCTSGRDDQIAVPRASVAIGPVEPAHLLQHAMLAFRSQDGAIAGGSRTHSAVVRDGAIELTPYTFENGERTAHAPATLATAVISIDSSLLYGGTASATIADGSALLQRGASTERLTNQVDGLHQEWSFASSPGSGDLVVEVAFGGYNYLATTAGGLHFIGDGVLVRYSHAIWSGSNGQQWPVAATYAADTGRIRMTIPANIVAATQFPALLDPTVSAEVAIDDPVVAPTGQTELQDAIAFGGGEYLAVWSDNRDSPDGDIWGARVASNGTLTDTLGIKIAATAGVQSRPAVTFDGTAFVVAWEDFQVKGGTTSKVTAARVATDGTVTSLGTVATSGSSQTTPNLASAGSGGALLVWNTAGEVDGAVVSSSIGSTVAIATGAVVERPSVASNPSGNYLVGYTATNFLMGQFVTSSGALSGSAITISAPASGLQSASDASFDGTNYDIVWRNGADAKVYGTRVSTAGTVLDTRTVGTATVGGIAINASPAISLLPTISCNSGGCLAAWQDQRNFSSTNYDLYGQLLTTAFAKNGAELALSTAAGPQQQPRAATDGTNFYLSWNDNRTLATNQIFGETVSSAGALGTASDIGTGNNRESAVAIGQAGSTTGLFWRDSRGGPSIYRMRYDSSGTALDTTASAVQSASSSQSSPSASADLGGNTLVVWQDTRGGLNNDIYGARVDLAGGTTLDASGITISTAANDQLVPAVASSGSVALVVWQDLRNGNFDVYGALINSSGAIAQNDIPISVGTGAQDNPAVTWDPMSSQFIVVWQDSRSGTFQIIGTRVDTSGNVLDTAGVGILSSTAAQDVPAVASTATNTLVIWHEANHVRGTRLSGGASLGVLDASGIAVSSTASNQGNPKVGVLGATYLAVWADDRAGNQDIYGQLVASDGSLNGSDFGISTSTDDEVLPRVAATGASSARVAYEARRLDTSRVVSRVITNAIASIAVTPANQTIPKGTTQQFTATATYSDGSTADVTSSVTWSSSNTTVATISSGGLATGANTGSTTITATSGAVSGSTTLTVAGAALASIAVTPATASVGIGFKQQFVATGTFTDGSTQNITSTVVWASSNTAVATISNMNGTRGIATVLSAGTTTISATQSGISGTATLNGTGATISSIAVTPSSNTMNVGQTKQLHATATFSDGSTLDVTTQVTWTSSNTAVATVGTSGVLKAVALGTATITASKNGVSGTASVSVVPPFITSITVTPANPWIAVGQTQAFTATAKLSDGTTQDVSATATWTSSNTTVATMSGNVATAAAAGTATITATSSGVSGTTTLNVTATPLVSIAVTPANPSVAVGYNIQFVATGTFMDGSTRNISSAVAWASSTTSVATISNTNGTRGIATVVATGTTSISASLNSITGSTTLTGTTATLTSIAVTPSTNTMTAGQTKQLRATGTFSDATTLDLTLQVAWSSSNTAVATIGTNGVVKAVATGSATITATKNGVSGTASVTVP